MYILVFGRIASFTRLIHINLKQNFKAISHRQREKNHLQNLYGGMKDQRVLKQSQTTKMVRELQISIVSSNKNGRMKMFRHNFTGDPD